jgi:hypothetical protein
VRSIEEWRAQKLLSWSGDLEKSTRIISHITELLNLISRIERDIVYLVLSLSGHSAFGSRTTSPSPHHSSAVSLFELRRIAHLDSPYTLAREGSIYLFPRTTIILHLEQRCVLFSCPFPFNTPFLRLSPRPVRHAYASKGVSHRQHSIILYIFAYKIISNLHYLNEIASNSPLHTNCNFTEYTPSYRAFYPFALIILLLL